MNKITSIPITTDYLNDLNDNPYKYISSYEKMVNGHNKMIKKKKRHRMADVLSDRLLSDWCAKRPFGEDEYVNMIFG